MALYSYYFLLCYVYWEPLIYSLDQHIYTRRKKFGKKKDEAWPTLIIFFIFNHSFRVIQFVHLFVSSQVIFFFIP